MAVHSYSSIKDFKDCEKKYHEVRVLKKYPFVKTVESEFGDRAHKALELCGRDGIPLPEEFKAYQWAIDDLVRKLPGQVYFEHEFSLSRTGSKVPPRDWNNKFWMGKADVLAIDGKVAYVIDWKGFPLDTEVPTPTGFVRMADIQVGDKVFGPDGEAYSVTGKSTVRIRPFHIKVMFADGASIVCDDDHLWQLDDGTVVQAKDLEIADRIPLPAPAQHAHTTLPVDPYVLGLWLADGKHTSGEVSKPDVFVWEEVQRRGYTVDMNTGGSRACPTRTIQGLRGALADLGVLGNKHIPEAYLTAAVEQRLDLLRGLMDGDGYANPTRRQCQFTNLNTGLMKQVHQLIASLGMRPYAPEVKYSGFGQAGTHTPTSFTPRFANPFLLPRKAAPMEAVVAADKHWRRENRVVAAIVAVPATPSQCISVDSPDNTYLVSRDYIVTHNTGKSKYPDPAQIDTMAMFTFMDFPAVEEVRGLLVFLQDAVTEAKIITRAEIPRLSQMHYGAVKDIEFAQESGRWVMKPTGLCPWCPVTDCPNWKPKPEGK